MNHIVFKATTNPQFFLCARHISSSASRQSRNCFRSFVWDKRGTTRFLEMRKNSKDPLLAPYDYGDRKPGITKEDGTFHLIPEMIPDIIVPDLKGFELKPYVTFRAPDVKREEFTSKQLFEAVYQSKIVEDYNKNELLEDGTPKNPSTEEKLTAEEAFVKARQTGTDIFAEDPTDPDPIERVYL